MQVIIVAQASSKLAILQGEPGWVKVITPFSRDFVDRLKLAVPYPHRRIKLNTLGKFECWEVSVAYLNETVKLIRECYPGIEIESDLTTEESDWVTSAFDACPRQSLDKLYRALSSVFHPDVGGDNKTMSRINTEFQRRRQ